MGFQSKITSKGQVTVPIEIRRQLGLRRGDRVEFHQKGTETVIRRAPEDENPFKRYQGIRKGLGGEIRSINRWISEMRDNERDED